MTDIRLISKRNRQIKPLVEAALANELRRKEMMGSNLYR